MKRVNLIPSEKKKQGIFTANYKFLLWIIVVLAGVSLWQATAISRYETSIAHEERYYLDLQKELRETRLSFQKLKEQREYVNNERKSLVARLSLLQSPKERSVAWSSVLDELSNALPKTLWLSKLSLNIDEVSFSGTALNNTSVSKLMAAVDGSQYLTDTNFKYIKKNRMTDKSIVDFVLYSQIRTEGAQP